MKQFKKSIILILTLLVIGSVTYAATKLFPYQGGTGSSAVPALNEMLVGTAEGVYAPSSMITFDSASDGYLTITGGQITGLTGLLEVDSGGGDYFAITNLIEGDILLVDSAGDFNFGSGNLTTSGTLTADSASIAGMNISNDGTITTLLSKSGDYVRIGDANITRHDLDSEDDLLVTGDLEVLENFYVLRRIHFDSMAANYEWQYLAFKEQGAEVFLLNPDYNNDQLRLAVGAGVGRQMILSNLDNYYRDFDHAVQTNPTFYIHSATDANSDNTQWISLTHNQTNGVIDVGTGGVVFPDNVGVGATSFGTNAVNVFAIGNGTQPTTSITDGIQLFASDSGAGFSELRVRDEEGNITTLSPHNFDLFTSDLSHEFPWSYYSQNSYLGKEINVDMFGAIREIENLSGKQFIYLDDIPKENWAENQEYNRETEIAKRMEEEIEISIEEAIEEVAVTEIVQVRTEMKYELDLENGKVEQIEVPVYGEVPTGEKEVQLKEGVRFDEETGKFYRKKTREEIELEMVDYVDKLLPDWIRLRIDPIEQ